MNRQPIVTQPPVIVNAVFQQSIGNLSAIYRQILRIYRQRRERYCGLIGRELLQKADDRFDAHLARLKRERK